jgi:hypothetical protein
MRRITSDEVRKARDAIERAGLQLIRGRKGRSMNDWLLPLFEDDPSETALLRETKHRFNNAVVRMTLVIDQLRKARECLRSSWTERALAALSFATEEMARAKADLESAEGLLRRHLT